MCVAAFSQNQALPKFSSGYPVADALVDYTDNLYQEGFVYETRGMARIGDWYLGQSVAAISSLRSAIGRIYRQMKENAAKKEQEDDPTGLLAFANALEQLKRSPAPSSATRPIPGGRWSVRYRQYHHTRSFSRDLPMSLPDAWRKRRSIMPMRW